MSKEDLIIKLDDPIFKKRLEDIVKRREECKAKGHLKPERHGFQYIPTVKVWMYCSHCKEFYERPLSNEEYDEEVRKIQKKLTEPMTI